MNKSAPGGGGGGRRRARPGQGPGPGARGPWCFMFGGAENDQI